MSRGPLDLVGHVAGILDALGVPYALGGSMASSLFGELRSTDAPPITETGWWAQRDSNP